MLVNLHPSPSITGPWPGPIEQLGLFWTVILTLKTGSSSRSGRSGQPGREAVPHTSTGDAVGREWPWQTAAEQYGSTATVPTAAPSN